MNDLQTKQLVTIEFRYQSLDTDGIHQTSQTATIGVFDTLAEAIESGNKVLEVLESKFPLNKHYNKKERFSEKGGCFGLPRKLVTNLGYLQTPFEFYAKIETLTYHEPEYMVNYVLNAVKAAKKWNAENQD